MALLERAFQLAIQPLITYGRTRSWRPQVRAWFDVAAGQAVNEAEFDLAPAATRTVTGVAKVLMLQVDAAGVTVAVTRNAQTVTLAVNQVIVIPCNLTTVVITNTNGAGDPVRCNLVTI